MRVRGHHFRGAVGGLLLGIATAIMFTLYSVIRLGAAMGGWIILAGLVLGLAWSFVAPQPKVKAATSGGGATAPPTDAVPPDGGDGA
jgi:hypothetical protein